MTVQGKKLGGRRDLIGNIRKGKKSNTVKSLCMGVGDYARVKI